MIGEIRDERGRLIYAPRSNAGHAHSVACHDTGPRTVTHRQVAGAARAVHMADAQARPKSSPKKLDGAKRAKEKAKLSKGIAPSRQDSVNRG